MLGLIKVQSPLRYARAGKNTNPLRYARSNKSTRYLEIC